MHKDTIIKILRLNYALVDVTAARIKAGVENENYLVTSDKEKKYVLRSYNSKHSIKGDRTLADIQVELDFLQKALEFGIKTPNVVKNMNNDLISIVEVEQRKRYVVLFEFLDGKSPIKFNEKITGDFGIIVNSFFKVGKTFECQEQLSKNIDIFTRTNKQLNIIHKIPENKHLEKIVSLKKELLVETNTIEELKLSKGLVHGDLKLENVLFTEEDTLSGVLDFDDYRYSYLLEEATMALMHNLHSTTENILRAGLYEIFITKLSNNDLLRELKYLKIFLKTRLIYDMFKYSASGNIPLVEELFEDRFIRKHILSL